MQSLVLPWLGKKIMLDDDNQTLCWRWWNPLVSRIPPLPCCQNQGDGDRFNLQPTANCLLSQFSGGPVMKTGLNVLPGLGLLSILLALLFKPFLHCSLLTLEFLFVCFTPFWPSRYQPPFALAFYTHIYFYIFLLSQTSIHFPFSHFLPLSTFISFDSFLILKMLASCPD